MKDLTIKGFPGIILENGEAAYGGSQDWFSGKWMRLAGCGSVAAANLAAYYGIGTRPDIRGQGRPVYSQAAYVELMGKMFSIMRPGMMGFPYAGRFRKRFAAYSAENGVCLKSKLLYSWDRADEAVSLVESSLRMQDPVALLLLKHREPAFDENTWHWMTITGYSPDTDRVMISNYGNKETMKASLLFEPADGNVARLISFHRI